MKKEGIRKPPLVAADLRRPAAIDQLETLAKQEGFDFRADRTATDVAAIVGRLVKDAEAAGSDVVIVDTAGRLQIDGELMDEVRRLRVRCGDWEQWHKAEQQYIQEKGVQPFQEQVPESTHPVAGVHLQSSPHADLPGATQPDGR